VFFLVLSLLLSMTHSLVMVQIPSDVIVNESKSILRGRVESVSYEKPANVIYTNYTFRIYSDGYIKSGTVDPSQNTINIKITGGIYGHEKLDLPGFPVLSVGSEYLLFLDKRGTAYDIYAASQGCLKVINTTSGDKVVAPCVSSYYNSIYIDQSASGPVTLDSFIKKIQGYQKS